MGLIKDIWEFEKLVEKRKIRKLDKYLNSIGLGLANLKEIEKEKTLLENAYTNIELIRSELDYMDRIKSSVIRNSFFFNLLAWCLGIFLSKNLTSDPLSIGMGSTGLSAILGFSYYKLKTRESKKKILKYCENLKGYLKEIIPKIRVRRKKYYFFIYY
ncbi:MAG: hypothetical protein DRP00_00300 [Candidatus Aenigmatarchaeota archaeon]|nr:MAG: hypothetical protein DRP00_00300 [Candidatus Aenigmarchaeota archaeon]